MPPKKDDAATAPGDAIAGFTSKETKMIAAAFVASTGPDKVHSSPLTSLRARFSNAASQYDYDLFATLTGNTAGSLRKMWPPVKRKVIDGQPSFGIFLGAATAGAEGAGEAKAKAAPKAKASGSKKRKTTSVEPEDEELDPEAEDAGKKKGPKGRKKNIESAEAEGDGEDKKPAAKRGRKKVKSAEEVVGMLSFH
jgi:hypothetical protein